MVYFVRLIDELGDPGGELAFLQSRLGDKDQTAVLRFLKATFRFWEVYNAFSNQGRLHDLALTIGATADDLKALSRRCFELSGELSHARLGIDEVSRHG